MESLLQPDGTVLEDVVDRLFRYFAIAECGVHGASSLQVRSQATVSCSQPEYSGLSCLARRLIGSVLVSSDSFPLTFLTISDQCFGLLVSGGG